MRRIRLPQMLSLGASGIAGRAAEVRDASRLAGHANERPQGLAELDSPVAVRPVRVAVRVADGDTLVPAAGGPEALAGFPAAVSADDCHSLRVAPRLPGLLLAPFAPHLGQPCGVAGRHGHAGSPGFRVLPEGLRGCQFAARGRAAGALAMASWLAPSENQAGHVPPRGLTRAGHQGSGMASRLHARRAREGNWSP